MTAASDYCQCGLMKQTCMWLDDYRLMKDGRWIVDIKIEAHSCKMIIRIMMSNQIMHIF